jgi:hypothetical protein
MRVLVLGRNQWRWRVVSKNVTRILISGLASRECQMWNYSMESYEKLFSEWFFSIRWSIHIISLLTFLTKLS